MLKKSTFLGAITAIVAVSTPVFATELKWSQAGPIAGLTCTKINEPADPNAWDDNYLCADEDLQLKWSSAGPIAGLQCVLINEPADIYKTWFDNYLCSPKDLGFVWKANGPVADMKCVRIYEDSEPAATAWQDNYLCLPKTVARVENSSPTEENQFPLRGRQVNQLGNQRRMNTQIILSETGQLEGRTRLSTRDRKQGFIGNVVVKFMDSEGTVIYSTPTRRFRVEANKERQELWSEQIPSEIVPQIYSSTIRQSIGSRTNQSRNQQAPNNN